MMPQSKTDQNHAVIWGEAPLFLTSMSSLSGWSAVPEWSSEAWAEVSSITRGLRAHPSPSVSRHLQGAPSLLLFKNTHEQTWEHRKHLYTASLIVSLSIFRLYLPAPHFAAPLHPVASEVVHLRPHTLPSHSSGRRPAETRDRPWAQRHARWSARQIWKHYWSKTNTESLSITRRTPKHSPLPSMSPYTLAHGVNSCCFSYSCILQSASNPVRPVHDLISTLISADTGSACKSCSFFCADNFWEVSPSNQRTVP